MFKPKPIISVCVPVFGTEQVLEQCLTSVIRQDFAQMEIVVVDDGSEPKEGQATAAAIIKKVQKTTKIPINFIKHKTNLGLVEARRTAVYAAKGQYIFNLDSDDNLPDGAIKSLYAKMVETGADVIQGKAKAFGDVSAKLLKIRQDRFDSLAIGQLFVQEQKNPILDGYLLKKNVSGFIWGKLIRREVYLEAFGRIPPITCTFAEDVIQSIWIYYYAKSYVAVDQVVYNYCANDGISSGTIITSLERWEKVCSTSGVFTALFAECQDMEEDSQEQQGNPFTEEQVEAIKIMAQQYVANNIRHLKHYVAPELQEQAYEMLCEYWGHGLVHYIEERL